MTRSPSFSSTPGASTICVPARSTVVVPFAVFTTPAYSAAADPTDSASAAARRIFMNGFTMDLPEKTAPVFGRPSLYLAPNEPLLACVVFGDGCDPRHTQHYSKFTTNSRTLRTF